MALVNKQDPKKIFASQAPSQDVPAEFNNYERGWDESRKNNGKPTIKQSNKLQQLTDEKILWMHQNGAALPFDETMEYAEGAVVVKDGELQQLKNGNWQTVKQKGVGEPYQEGETYDIGDEVRLENGDRVQSTIPNNTNNPNIDMTGWVNPLADLIRKTNRVLTASQYGIKGDGTDEAAKVQLMFDNIKPGTIVDLEGLTVTCGVQVAITQKRNFRVENGYIKASPNSTTSTENRVIFLNVCTGFVLNNLDFDGNRQNRTPQEKSIHTITFRECKNFFCFNVNAWNSVCDGFYFDCRTPLDKSTHSQNGFFYNCKSDNAYRNSAAIIVGHDLHFNNCEFTGANGTLPMAGFDLESNGYGGDGLIENIFFNNCKFKNNVGWQLMVTQHDKPRNIFVNGGEIVAPNVSDKWMLSNALVPAGTVGAAQLPNASNCGGCLVTNSDTTLSGVTFKDFPLGSGIAFRVGSNPGGFAKLLGCKFKDLYVTGSNASSFQATTVNSHNLSDGVYISDRCEFDNCAMGIALNNPRDVLQHSHIKASAGVSMGLTAYGAKVVSNTFEAGISTRYVFSEATNTTISDNIMTDLANSSPIAFIQAEKAGSVVERNLCKMTNATTMTAVRFDAAVGYSLKDNTAINMGNNPYFILNSAVLNGAVISNNSGGTQRISTPVQMRQFTTVNRPAANAVPVPSSIFDTTLNKVITSNGVSWYDANGTVV